MLAVERSSIVQVPAHACQFSRATCQKGYGLVKSQTEAWVTVHSMQLSFTEKCDVVVGAGHAGVEPAMAAARPLGHG
jgi:hypothetical protein